MLPSPAASPPICHALPPRMRKMPAPMRLPWTTFAPPRASELERHRHVGVARDVGQEVVGTNLVARHRERRAPLHAEAHRAGRFEDRALNRHGTRRRYVDAHGVVAAEAADHGVLNHDVARVAGRRRHREAVADDRGVDPVEIGRSAQDQIFSERDRPGMGRRRIDVNRHRHVPIDRRAASARRRVVRHVGNGQHVIACRESTRQAQLP